MAITWRNIEAPNMRGPAAIMESASNSLNRGFAGLGDVLKQHEEAQKAQWEQGRETNTNAALMQLSQAQSPEELAALRGQLVSAMQNQGRQVDALSVLDKFDSRLSGLRKQAQDEIVYKNTLRDEQEAPVVDQIKSLIAQGKVAEAAALREGRDFRDDAGLSVFGAQNTRLFAQDKRLEAGEQRAAESQAQQRARFGWAQGDQADKVRQKDNERYLNEKLFGLVQGLQQQEQSNWDITQQTAEDMNIPLGKDGTPVLDSPEQASAFKSRLLENGAVPLDPSAEYNKGVQRLIAEASGRGIKPQDILAFNEGVGALQQVSKSLLPEDQARLDQATAQQAEAAAQRVKRLEAQQAKVMAANPYAGGPFNVEEGVVDVMSALPEDFDPMGINSSQKEMLSGAVEQHLRDGLPPAIAKMIVTKVGDRWGITDDIDDFFNQEVEAMTKNGTLAKLVSEVQGDTEAGTPSLFEQQLQQRQQVQAEEAAKLEEIRKYYRGSKGVAPTSFNNYLKGLDAYTK